MLTYTLKISRETVFGVFERFPKLPYTTVYWLSQNHIIAIWKVNREINKWTRDFNTAWQTVNGFEIITTKCLQIEIDKRRKMIALKFGHSHFYKTKKVLALRFEQCRCSTTTQTKFRQCSNRINFTEMDSEVFLCYLKAKTIGYQCLVRKEKNIK